MLYILYYIFFAFYYYNNQEGRSSPLIVFLEKWRESVDQGHVFGALLTDLSKAFGCLPYNLLIAKLNAYGFDNNAVRFVYNYLTT